MARWAILVSVVFGLVAAWLMYDYGQSLARDEKGVTYLQLKPGFDIAANASVPAEAVVSVTLPERFSDMASLAIPDTRQNRSWIAGREASTDITGGGLLLYEHFSEAPTEQFSGRIASGMRAMSIAVNPSTAVSFFVEPGSRVDVVGAFRTVEYRPVELPGQASGGKEASVLPMEAYVAKTLVQNARVLAVGGASSQRGYQALNDVGYGTVTIEVTPMQAELLTFAMPQLEGKLNIVLRNPADDAQIDIPRVYWDGIGERTERGGI